MTHDGVATIRNTDFLGNIAANPLGFNPSINLEGYLGARGGAIFNEGTAGN